MGKASFFIFFQVQCIIVQYDCKYHSHVEVPVYIQQLLCTGKHRKYAETSQVRSASSRGFYEVISLPNLGLLRGPVMVVSPLNVIQTDQMEKLRAKGISSGRLDMNCNFMTLSDQVTILSDCFLIRLLFCLWWFTA